MISGRKYQGFSGSRLFTRWVKSVKQAKFRLSDIQPVYLKKTAQFREHSEDEDRWILMGKSLSESILVVVHTFRNDGGAEIVRIISARKAIKNEKQAYHKRCPK